MPVASDGASTDKTSEAGAPQLRAASDASTVTASLARPSAVSVPGVNGTAGKVTAPKAGERTGPARNTTLPLSAETEIRASGAFVYTWMTREPLVELHQDSTMRTNVEVLASGGRPASSEEMLPSHQDRYHQAGDLAKPETGCVRVGAKVCESSPPNPQGPPTRTCEIVRAKRRRDVWPRAGLAIVAGGGEGRTAQRHGME